MTRVANSQIDIQTLPWPEIVKLIGEIRKHNPITSLSNNPNLGDMVGEDVDVNIKKLDAHDVAKYVPTSLFSSLYLFPPAFSLISVFKSSFPYISLGRRAA